MNTRLRLSRWDAGVLVLLLLPLGLLCLNSNWIFNFPGWADQWIYFGNQEGLWRKLKLFGDSYRTTRFSWDLPGALCDMVLPPMAARLTFHLGFYYGAILSFYVIGKQTLGSRAALLGALLMGGYPLTLTSLGWDYVDGACQTYFLLSLLCVLKAVETASSKVFLTLAGVFFAAGVYAYPASLLYGPFIGGFFLLRNTPDRRVSLTMALRLFGLGLLGLTLVFCLVYFCATKRFFFFLPSFKTTSDLLKVKDLNPMAADWFLKTRWLVFPAAVFAASMASAVGHLVRRPALDETGRAALFFQLAHSVLFLGFLACQVWLHFPFIYCPFYISLLTPVTFLALAGLVRPGLERLSVSAWRGLLCGVGFLLAAPLFPGLRPFLAPLVSPPLLWALGVIVGVLLLATLAFHSRWLLASFVLAGTVAGGLDTFLCPWVGRALDGRDSLSNRDVHLAFAQSHKYLHEIWPRQPYRFWFPLDDPLTKAEVYFSLAISTNVGNFVVVNEKFPTHGNYLAGAHVFMMEPGTKVVVLSNEEEVLPRTKRSLGPLGLTASLVAERQVRQGPVAYTMTFLQVDKLPGATENAQAGRSPPAQQ